MSLIIIVIIIIIIIIVFNLIYCGMIISIV